MAFTTTRGAAGTDAFDVKFEGTAGVDALFALNEKGVKLVDALAGNDTIDMFDESGVVGTATVVLGEGNDTFTMGANSTITNRLDTSEIKGGPGNDNITTEGSLSSILRGNEGNDDFFLLSNYTDTTINGNDGVDSFTLIEATAAGTTNAVVLSDSKILGGKGNDGQMDFTDAGLAAGTASLRAIDSVIQGGEGLDTISIGRVESGTSGFRVSGGKDNDTINVDNTNGSSDGIAYNGAEGDDEINFLDANAADAVTKGGNGNDRYTIGSGSGAIDALGEAGDDTFILNTVQQVAATATSGGGKMTITGGAGGDVYTIEDQADSAAGVLPVTVADREGIKFVIKNVSDSAAATSGTALTFDSFTADAAGTGTIESGLGDIIDITGGSGEALVGNRLNSDEVTDQVLAGRLLADSTATSFGDLKAALDGNLTASQSNVLDPVTGAATNTGRISLQMVEVDSSAVTLTNGAIDGYYAILNNTNTILDAGDMMFKMSTPVGDAATNNDGLAAVELANIAAAIEAGF